MNENKDEFFDLSRKILRIIEKNGIKSEVIISNLLKIPKNKTKKFLDFIILSNFIKKVDMDDEKANPFCISGCKNCPFNSLSCNSNSKITWKLTILGKKFLKEI